MGGVDYALSIWHIVDFVDKDGALFRQLIHNIPVMNNFAADVDGCTEGFERDFNDVDGTDNTSAEATRFQQKYPLLIGRYLAGDTVGDRVERSCSHTIIISICQEFTRVQHG